MEDFLQSFKHKAHKALAAVIRILLTSNQNVEVWLPFSELCFQPPFFSLQVLKTTHDCVFHHYLHHALQNFVVIIFIFSDRSFFNMHKLY